MKWYYVEPIPVKRRPRVTKIGNVYTEPNTRADMQRIKDSWDGEFYATEPLKLEIHVYCQLPNRPKCVTSEPYTVKPDVDNIAKCVMDGLQGVAFSNDKQIVMLIVWKRDRTREIEGEFITYSLEPM